MRLLNWSVVTLALMVAAPVIADVGEAGRPLDSASLDEHLVTDPEFVGAGGARVLYALANDNNSLYTLNVTSGSSSLVGSCGVDLGIAGMAWDSWNNVMYVSDVEDGGGYSLGRVDLTCGAITLVGPHVNSTRIVGLAFDSTYDVLYGADLDCLTSSGGLALVNRTTGESTCIGAWGTTSNIRVLAYNRATDTLYGADDVNLYTLNRATGAATVVGPHGTGFGGPSVSLEFDAQSGILYGADAADGNLYNVDMTTGVATLVGSTGLGPVSALAFTGERGEPCEIFCDGFESGNTAAWSAGEPPFSLLPNAPDLLWYYSADAPGAGNYPIDVGPLELGTMTHVGSMPGLSVSAGPNGHSAWGPFVSSGFFKNAGASTTYATGDYTVVVMFQKQPYDAGSLPYILGYDDVADDFSTGRLEGGHFTNGGGTDSQTFTWSANTPTACDSGGPASPDMNWYIFGAYKAPGSQSIVSTFLTTVGNLTDIATGELQAGAISSIGDEVRLGGQHDLFLQQGMRGYIWKALAWTGQPSRFDIYAWAKFQAGF